MNSCSHLSYLSHFLGKPALGYAGGYVYDLFNKDSRDYAWGAMQDGYVSQYGLHHWWLVCVVLLYVLVYVSCCAHS